LFAHFELATQHRQVEYAHGVLSQGDNVRITQGAFAGLEAVVTQILPVRERVKILMDFLGRKVEAEVDSASLRSWPETLILKMVLWAHAWQIAILMMFIIITIDLPILLRVTGKPSKQWNGLQPP
jgi:hypothetical protein